MATSELPAGVSSGSRPLKRKANGQRTKANVKKARRSQPSQPPSIETLPTNKEEVLKLESQILESRTNYNSILGLILLLERGTDPELVGHAALVLCRVFIRLIVMGELRLRTSGPNVVRLWLRNCLSRTESCLTVLLEGSGVAHIDADAGGLAGDSGSGRIATLAVALLMRLLKAKSNLFKEKHAASHFRTSYRQIVQAVLQSRFADARTSFTHEFLRKYADVRYYGMKALAEVLSDGSLAGSNSSLSFATGYPAAARHPEGDVSDVDSADEVEELADSREAQDEFRRRKVVTPAQERSIPDEEARPGEVVACDHALSILEGVGSPSEVGGVFYIGALGAASEARKRRPVSEAWLAALAVGLGSKQRRRVLKNLSTQIAPWFSRPEQLADFLTDCFDEGGAASQLALSGIWYLMRERQLDYPSFYAKLYSLLDADMIHSKHRTPFFRLLDTFLASSHLPSTLVASFIKRLSRLLLNSPPSAIVFAVPWMYNLFRQHPLCTVMMHRVRPRGSQPKLNAITDDPFQPHEPDPIKTRAIDSSIWEVVQLQSHYDANVAVIAKIISEQFTKACYNLEDFLDHTYSSMLAAEFSKNLKTAPEVEFKIPQRVFRQDEPGNGPEHNVITTLCDFV